MNNIHSSTTNITNGSNRRKNVNNGSYKAEALDPTLPSSLEPYLKGVCRLPPPPFGLGGAVNIPQPGCVTLPETNMNYSLNSLKGDYIGDIMRDY